MKLTSVSVVDSRFFVSHISLIYVRIKREIKSHRKFERSQSIQRNLFFLRVFIKNCRVLRTTSRQKCIPMVALHLFWHAVCQMNTQTQSACTDSLSVHTIAYIQIFHPRHSLLFVAFVNRFGGRSLNLLF